MALGEICDALSYAPGCKTRMARHSYFKYLRGKIVGCWAKERTDKVASSRTGLSRDKDCARMNVMKSSEGVKECREHAPL